MEDVHHIFTRFKEEFSDVYEGILGVGGQQIAVLILAPDWILSRV